MKRLGLIMMSVALMLGMAQCKKNVETVSEGIGNQNFTDGEIRLKVNDDGKLAVFPHTGGVYYTEGDVIYVASGGKYRGTMTYTVSDDGGYFSGTLTSAPSSGATLYFYYLGGKTPTETLTAGTTSTLTVNISDQTTSYPVIAYGEATEKYGTTSTYHATLKNVGALVKFDVTSSSSKAATCITGMNNQVSFALSSSSVGTPTPSKADTDGIIKLPAGSGERWAVLLPQDAVSEGILGSAYTPDGHYYGSRGAVPAIKANDYLSNGITVSLSPTEIGVFRGQFTVNGDGTRVRFSKGNLQYQPSTATWRFAENQYDYIGNTPANATPSASQTEWMDLFGWGTSGAGSYFPYLSTLDNSYYPYPGEFPASIAGTEYDWGMNYISNGSSAKTWRTLTKDEWVYLINTRTGAEAATVNETSDVRFCLATINTDADGVRGMIIFPDGATVDGTAATTWGTLNYNVLYTTEFTTEQWIALEDLGCVFLPVTGIRGSSGISNTAADGHYWSTTASSNIRGCNLYFNHQGVRPSSGTSRYAGIGVRLVCE